MRGAHTLYRLLYLVISDHPRGCGEHETAYRFVIPFVWIIPADAGSTMPTPISRIPPRDHPRGCGEHLGEIDVLLTVLGSSPRMRGARILKIVEIHGLGIIPADAGSTGIVLLSSSCIQDHPRGCGEHRLYVGMDTRAEGSSPRMRGAPCRL